MTYDGRAALSGTSDYVAAQLPYAGDRFAAQIIKPLTGSLANLINTVTPATLSAVAAAEPVDQSQIRLPKFVAQTFTQLDAALTRLGMRQAFTPSADFSPLSTVPLNVETVVQRDYLKVDEVGTEAAAVTGVGIEAQGAHLIPAFDAPFLFLVRDTQTGVVLFAGQIVDPSAS
jgi:serpin B